MMKGLMAALTGLWLSAMLVGNAYGGQWQQDSAKADNNEGITNWWWQNDDGSYPCGDTAMIDGNHDGIAEQYMFNEDGWMYADTKLFSGTVGPDGAVIDGDGSVYQVPVPKGINQGAISWNNSEYMTLLGKTEEQVREQLAPGKLERAGYSYMDENFYDLFYYVSDTDEAVQFSDYISLHFQAGVLERITVPLIQLIDGLPVTCSGKELDTCLSEIGLTSYSEYSADYFSERVYWYEVDNYNIKRRWSGNQKQFSFTEKVQVTRLN